VIVAKTIKGRGYPSDATSTAALVDAMA